MQRPEAPPAAPLTGTERLGVVQKGRYVMTTLTAIAALLGVGPKGDPGSKGDKGDKGDTGGKGEPGTPTVLPATMSGVATTLATGKAALDWSALKLTAPPRTIVVSVIGTPKPWSFDSDPTKDGAVVSVVAEKPTAVLSVTVLAPGGQPASGVRLAWTVTA